MEDVGSSRMMRVVGFLTRDVKDLVDKDISFTG